MIENYYIHIPFCRQKCSYCNFSTIQNSDNQTHEKYFFALRNEIKNYFLQNPQNKIKTIYFGGGTPSAVDTKYILEILDIFRKNFGNLENIEILLESNPEDLEGENGIKKLENLKNIGVTKISTGIQSFQEKFFDFFERKNYEAEKIILNAKKFFPNLSIDLIFGIPNQTEEDLQKDLKIIKKLDLKHISYYALDYKKNSKIENKKNNPEKNFKPIKFKTVKKYYFQILDFLKQENFEQYEFYNFCKNTSPCHSRKGGNPNYNLHNKNFWELENYYGFGLSAVGSDGETVFTNTKNLKNYLEQKKFQEKEKILGFEKNFLELQKIFHLTRWKNTDEIKKILEDEIVLEKILNSNFIEKKYSQEGKYFIRLNNQGIMHFEDFFEEIFS